MAWTYGADPSANARDAIRFLCGDTDTNDQLLNDAEIGWINNQITGSDTATTALYEAAYRACIAIASKFSRLASQAVGDLRVDLHQKAENTRAQAKELKLLAAREGNVPTPYAGGITFSDKQVDQGNSNIVPEFFSRGQFRDARDGADSVVSNHPGAND